MSAAAAEEMRYIGTRPKQPEAITASFCNAFVAPVAPGVMASWRGGGEGQGQVLFEEALAVRVSMKY